MTRDEHRAKCIKAIGDAVLHDLMQRRTIRNVLKTITPEVIAEIEHAIGAAAFYSLHGIARVNPVEATREMMGSGQSEAEEGASLGRIYAAMSAAGDLTNPTEKKT